MNHKSKDSHHGGTSVVQLNGTLGELGLLIELIPSEVNVSVTEVTNVLVSGSGNITHEGTLKDSDEGDDLDKSSSGDGVRSEKGGNTVGERVEGISSIVDGSRKVDSGTGDNLSKEGKLSMPKESKNQRGACLCTVEIDEVISKDISQLVNIKV